MDGIGSRLKDARIKRGFTQKQLAKKLQCGDKAISCYENNKNLDKIYDFIKICQCLDADINYIITGKEYSNGKEISSQEQQILSAYYNLTDSDRRVVDFILGTDIQQPQYPDNIIHLIDTGNIIEIDTYQEPVSAGNGNVVDNSSLIPQLYPQTKISSQADFCVKVSGDSMYPLYESGDILFVKRIEESDIKNNDIGIFFYIDDSYCKRYNEEDGNILLISENSSKYKPIEVYQYNKFKVLGKVLGKYHVD